MKRTTDQIDRKIAEWQKMRSDFGPTAPAMLGQIIDTEIGKLSRERALRAQPQSDGRRTTDGWPT